MSSIDVTIDFPEDSPRKNLRNSEDANVGRTAMRKATWHLIPLIALGYVWVTITAVVAFHETMNPFKIVGLLVIISGVAVLGIGGGAGAE